MTRANAVQEIIIMALLLCGVGIVFLETAGVAPVAPGQLSPSAFPRLAAGVIGALAILRIILILAMPAERPTTPIWPIRSFPVPAALGALMIAYFLLFERVHFAALTAGFLAAAYLLMRVRPFGKLLAASVLGTGAMYLLFTHLLSIAV